MSTATLHMPELERLVRQVDPGAMLLSPKLLRRVIRKDRHWRGLLVRVPHQGNYLIALERFDEILAALEEPRLAGVWPNDLVLLSNTPPTAPVGLSEQGQELFLRTYYWRQLFHAWVHQYFPKLTTADVRKRLDRLGETLWEEARLALKQERLLLPPVTEASTYEEFVAYYCELKHFAPHLLPLAFPSLTEPVAVETLISEDIDAAGLLERTRPEGVDAPLAWKADLRHAKRRAVQVETRKEPNAKEYERLAKQADQAAAQGNFARAAWQRRVMMSYAAPEDAEKARLAVRADIAQLAQRLTQALALPEKEVPTWEEALWPLVPSTAERAWPTEAKVLYELQKICVDQERGIFTVDVIEYLRSLGSRPVKRPLPWAEAVMRLERLRQAEKLLAETHLPPEHLVPLDELLEHALEQQEKLQREKLRPLLTQALDAVGLVPHNVAEGIAQKKVVEELIDRILTNGHLNLGELRDALSRNQLKLSDLSGPREFWNGDPLLQLDKRLSLDLDGVYRRGEFYLRWFQRLSSIFFGTPVGRFLTRFGLLPFLGAFVVLEGLQHIIGPILKPILGYELHLVSTLSVFITGYILLGLIYVDRFRKEVWNGLKVVGRGLKYLFVDVGREVAQSQAVQAVWQSAPMQVFRQHLFLPLVVAIVVWIVAFFLGVDSTWQWILTSAAFALTLSFFSTRPGRRAREMLLDGASRFWHMLTTDFVLRVLRFIWDFFRWLVARLDHFLYAMDERLRFHGGESGFSLGMKATIGAVWFFIAYVIRFAVNLLLEPQINPIKHFPVVTVSHKLILPMAAPGGALSQAFQTAFGLTATTGNALAGSVVWGIPGIFGFLVWELKENWKLYGASRSATLEPVIVGHHGETMLRLMRPGFHSGTLPKLYGKLRRAEAVQEHSPKGLKLHHELQHVAEEVDRLIERDFIAPLETSAAWQGKSLRVHYVQLGAKQVSFALSAALWPELLTEITFREKHGWLLARVTQTGWVPHLSAEQREAFFTALAGLYKLAGVDLVEEQLAQMWPAESFRHGIDSTGVAVRTRGGQAAVYPWTDEDIVAPEPPLDGLPTIPTPRLYFSRLPIAWQHWVVAWEREQIGHRADLPLHEVRLLPERQQEKVVKE